MHPAVLAYNDALKAFIQKIHHADFEQMKPEEYVSYTDAWLTDQFIKASLDPSSRGYGEACILMKKSKKIKIKESVHSKKSPGPLVILKSDGSLETLYPTRFIEPLFSKGD